MEIKRIDGVDHTLRADYLSADFDVEINHLLVDMQDKKIVTHKKMNAAEKEKLNAKARKVGEVFLVWVPALFDA